MKQIFLALEFQDGRKYFNDYCHAIKEKLGTFFLEPILLEQYAITFTPFSEWENGIEPCWHKAYNNIKHNRSENYKEANLKNTLLSLSALYTTVMHYYLCSAQIKTSINERNLLDIINSLSPHSKMMQFVNHYQSYFT